MKYSIKQMLRRSAPGTPQSNGSERAFAVLIMSGMLRIV